MLPLNRRSCYLLVTLVILVICWEFSDIAAIKGRAGLWCLVTSLTFQDGSLYDVKSNLPLGAAWDSRVVELLLVPAAGAVEIASGFKKAADLVVIMSLAHFAAEYLRVE